MYDINGSKQEVFDRVVTHLAQQGEPALCMLLQGDETEEYSCAYRTPDGKMCAAGCLIPDEKYKPEFENATFSGVLLSSTLTCDPDLVDFIENLQMAHDARVSLHQLQSELRHIANGYGINADSVDLITEWRV